MFSFSEIVGHEQIKEHMQAAIRDKKPFHAYLFQDGVRKSAGCYLGNKREGEPWRG